MQTVIDPNLPAVIDVAKKLGAAENRAPQTATVEGIQVLVTQNSAGTVVMTPLTVPEALLQNPKRQRAKVELYEARSFINYLKAHKVAGRTHVFGEADELGGEFTAILDYHDEQQSVRPPADEAATANPVLVAQPCLAHFGEHVAVLTLETTPEWKRWVQNDRKLLTQEAFAEFIEDNMNDIIEPDAATILETAQQLQGKKTVTFKAGRNLRNGAIALEYSEDIDVAGGGTNRQAGQLQLPDRFKLGLVPFVGANGVEIDARLRFRIGTDGKVGFMYVLNRPYEVIEKAFAVARADIEDATQLAVHLGTAAIIKA